MTPEELCYRTVKACKALQKKGVKIISRGYGFYWGLSDGCLVPKFNGERQECCALGALLIHNGVQLPSTHKDQSRLSQIARATGLDVRKVESFIHGFDGFELNPQYDEPDWHKAGASTSATIEPWRN